MEKQVNRGYVDGCFDLMHSGHYNAIRQAKAICKYLIVGIHSDAEIERNKSKPIMNQEERYGQLEHIKWIDEIVVNAPYSPTVADLDKWNADVCIHGDDLPLNSEGKCAYEDLIAAGRFKVIKRTEGVSTTDIVGRLLLFSRDHLRTVENIASVEELKKLQKTNPLGLPSVQSLKRSMFTTTRRIAEFAGKRAPPKPEDVVVYIDGSFDLFHVGHASTLKKAKNMGTYLIVGVFDDETVNKLKGSNYPIMNLHERVLNVTACKWVDEVIIGSPVEISQHLIDSMNINVVVEASLKDGNTSTSLLSLPRDLGILAEVESDWPYLTSSVIASRIVENHLLYVERNRKREKLENEFFENRSRKLTEV